MAKYKICPVCGEHNEPVMLECFNCETDLSSTRVIDENTERAQAEQNMSNNIENISSRMIRVCDCGYKNLMQSRKCQKCGEDISMVVPVADTKETNERKRYIVSSVDGTYAYELNFLSTVIGRENELQDYVENKSFVSRKHAEFRIEEDKLFIVNFSHTNYTYINNIKVDDENPRELKDGDEIGLGGNSQNGQRQDEAAYFVIRSSSCS